MVVSMYGLDIDMYILPMYFYLFAECLFSYTVPAVTSSIRALKKLLNVGAYLTVWIINGN